MIDRLLLKDIGRQENFRATITSGTKKDYRTSFNIDGGQEYFGETKDGVINFYYTNPAVLTITTATIYLGLPTVPLVSMWLLDVVEQPAGVPHPVLNPEVHYKETRQLSGSPTTLPGINSTLRYYWNKSEVKLVITVDGGGGIGTPTYLARVKFAVYYDDLGLQEQGF